MNEMMADQQRKLESLDKQHKRQNVKCVHAVFLQTLKKAGIAVSAAAQVAPDMSLEQLISDFSKTFDEQIIGRADDATVQKLEQVWQEAGQELFEGLSESKLRESTLWLQKKGVSQQTTLKNPGLFRLFSS